MRALAKILARRPPVARGRLDQRDAALAPPDRALTAHTAVASYGPERAAAAQSNPLRAEHTRTATQEDIFYCFRLLLGRSPNPEEWPGHSSRAGENLANVVSSYVTCREFAARGLSTKTYRDQVELVQFPRFSMFAAHDDLAVGRHVA